HYQKKDEDIGPHWQVDFFPTESVSKRLRRSKTSWLTHFAELIGICSRLWWHESATLSRAG
ncbi:hypothetical protein VU06_04255, partial [Desulfobulbus sp. F3]|nr:hypothetical protein [Desulfobulbus sp. F3]